MPGQTYRFTVQALVYDGANIPEVVEFMGGERQVQVTERQLPGPGRGLHPGIVINTLRQKLTASAGDWIVQTDDGKFSVVKADDFTGVLVEERREASAGGGPSVGRAVHYVDRDGSLACRAATVTVVHPSEGAGSLAEFDGPQEVGLVVMLPSTQEHPAWTDHVDRCRHSEGSRTRGTWHWPERV